MLVCDVIAPHDGKQLFQAMMTAGVQGKADGEAMADDMVKNSNVRVQICQEQEHEDVNPEFIRLQVLGKHFEKAPRTVWQAFFTSNTQSTMSSKEPGSRYCS